MFDEANELRNFDIFDKFESLANGEAAFMSKYEKSSHSSLINIVDKRDGYEGKTLLHHCGMLGYADLALYLLNIGHIVDVVDLSSNLKTPLMEAIDFGFFNVVTILLSKGASALKKDIRMENAFHYAARSGSRMVRTVVKATTGQGLTSEALKSLTSSTNVKLRFPEDVAVNSTTQDVLIYLREHGSLPAPMVRHHHRHTGHLPRKK